MANAKQKKKPDRLEQILDIEFWRGDRAGFRGAACADCDADFAIYAYMYNFSDELVAMAEHIKGKFDLPEAFA